MYGMVPVLPPFVFDIIDEFCAREMPKSVT
jgi:hypothetical protein